MLLSLSLWIPLSHAATEDRPAFDAGVVRLDRGDGVILDFTVEIARTPRQWSYGLMHVTSLPAGQGMLFVFPSMAPRSFWMKNTLIPLDMMFFDERGGLVSAFENVPPHSLQPRRPDGNAQFVLELNGGTMAIRGLGAGTRLLRTDADAWSVQ